MLLGCQRHRAQDSVPRGTIAGLDLCLLQRSHAVPAVNWDRQCTAHLAQCGASVSAAVTILLAEI